MYRHVKAGTLRALYDIVFAYATDSFVSAHNDNITQHSCCIEVGVTFVRLEQGLSF